MNKAILLLVLLTMSVIVNSQTILRELSRNIVAIEYHDSITNRKFNRVENSIATGTFVLYKYNDSHTYLFLVTNRHALPTIQQAFNIYVKMNHYHDSVNTSPLILTVPITMDNFKRNPDIEFGKDDNDIAVINFSGYLGYKDELEVIKYSLRNEDFATKDTLRKYLVSTGREIVFVGYPNFFYNKKNVEPIVRRGIISTDPLVDFYFSDDLINIALKKKKYYAEKLNGFLIDANAIGGSSGSLVMITPYPFPLKQGNIEIPALTNYKIAGILTYSYFDEIPDKAERINLGGVIASEIILDTMQNLSERLSKQNH